MAAALAAGMVTAADAAVYLTQQEALALAFPGARIERHALVLTEAEKQAVERAARARLTSLLVAAYAGWRGDTLAGVAFFDQRTVRTMPGVFMTVVAPDSTLQRVDVLAFHEPPDYRPPARWLDRFGGRRLDDRLWPARDLRNLAGATLSARSVTESARLALAIYARVLGPKLAAGPRAAAERR